MNWIKKGRKLKVVLKKWISLSLALLLTLGLSQDSSKICLPEEQVRALFEDAQLLPLCKEEKELYKLVILNRDTTIKIQDELIINLESQIISRENDHFI